MPAERPRAIALAREAFRLLSAHPGFEAEVATIEKWLQARPQQPDPR